MNFSAIAIDDEPLAIAALEQMLSRFGDIHLLGSASDAAAGLALLHACRADVVFLDISMPGMDGLELARVLRALPQPPLVILVTAYDHYGTEAFDCAVVDYVLKPLQRARLMRACERAAQLLAARTPRQAGARAEADLWVPHLGSVVRVPPQDVLRIEADRDYARIHVEGRSYLMRGTLNALEQRLDPARFVRIHRSTIVRLDRLRGLRHEGGGRWSALDCDGHAAMVGRSYLAELRARLGLGPDPDLPPASFVAA